LKKLVFYIVLPIIYLVSVLPFPLLYLLSDLLFFLLFRVLGYRKKVVLKNLKNSFPDYNTEKIDKTCRDFYKYFCDMTLETLKTLTITKKEMLRRCSLSPGSFALLEGLAIEQKSVILVLGHYGNWEWAGNSFSLQCRHHLYVIYHPLSNVYFDKLMYQMRTRFGTGLIPMKTAFKEMLAKRSELNATAFIADQTPMPESACWTTFLNQDTPVFKGTELIARKMNLPVVYVSVQRRQRGFYTVCCEMLCAQPGETEDGDISVMHTQRLERDIISDPAIWLWSHRRWKHRRPGYHQNEI